jgi:serine/threonine protein kinase
VLTTTSSLRETALDLHAGALYFGMQALRTASRDRLLPASLEDQLRRALIKVMSSLDVARGSLECVDETTVLGKLRYTLWTGKGSKHQLDRVFQDLKTSCDEVTRLHLQFMSVSTSRTPHLLPAGIFKLKRETKTCDPGVRLPNSDIVVAEGSYSSDRERVDGIFVLERKAMQNENELQFLSARLSEPGKGAGVLPLLGYHKRVYQEPGNHKDFELVFQMPTGHVCESLANRIVESPIPDIAERLRLCHAVSTAVVSIHTLDLVHKAITSRTILMSSGAGAQAAGYSMYLQDWSHIRELSGATSKCGNDDNWPKRIYQHPERQSTMLEEAYGPQHDIYSLGVCMLEVLLWTPFVIEKVDASDQVDYEICRLFETRRLALGAQGVSVEDGGLPARYKGISAKIADNARATCAIWKDIVRTSLQYDAADVVLKCLEGRIATAAEVSEELQAMIRACG